MIFNDQLVCVDQRCNLPQKLIQNWSNILQHVEQEHKILTIKQFKQNLSEKDVNQIQYNDERINQYLSQAEQQLDLVFDEFEQRLYDYIKQELLEIYHLCLQDITGRIERKVKEDTINLDNFDNYFQSTEYQNKCFNFYNNKVQYQIEEIINQFCKQQDISLQDIFTSLNQSFTQKKQILLQPQYIPQEQHYIQPNEEELPPLKGYKQFENNYQEQKYPIVQEFEQYTPLHKAQNQTQPNEIKIPPLTIYQWLKNTSCELIKPIVSQVEQSNSSSKMENQPQPVEEDLPPLKGYKQVEKSQFEQKKQTDNLYEVKNEQNVAFKQVSTQESTKISNTQIQKPTSNQPQIQYQSAKVQKIKKQIPNFNQINESVDIFSLQLCQGQIEFSKSFKSAKSQDGFVLFEGYFKKNADILLNLLILERDKKSVIEIGIIDWSIFQYPRVIGEPQEGIYAINNDGIIYKNEEIYQSDSLFFSNQTILKIKVYNRSLQFYGLETAGIGLSQWNGNLSFYAYLKNGQVKIVE